MTAENLLQPPVDALDDVLEAGYDNLPSALERANAGGADAADDHLLASTVSALEAMLAVGSQPGVELPLTAGDDATLSTVEATGGDHVRTIGTVGQIARPDGSDGLEARVTAYPLGATRTDEIALLTHTAPGVPPEARVTEGTFTRAGQSTSWVVESTVAPAAGREGQQQGPAVTIGAVRRSGPATR